MKKVNSVNTIFKYNGKLHEVTSIAYDKVIFHKEIGVEACKLCGEFKEYSDVQDAPDFQQASEPVETLTN